MVFQGQLISKANYGVLDSSKKRTLWQFSVHKIAPAFVFWKNPGQHFFFEIFWPLVDTFIFEAVGVFRKCSIFCYFTYCYTPWRACLCSIIIIEKMDPHPHAGVLSAGQYDLPQYLRIANFYKYFYLHFAIFYMHWVFT